MAQNEVSPSAFATSDLCVKNWILNESTIMQEPRRGGDSQGVRMVTNQHKDIGRLNRHIELFNYWRPKIRIQSIFHAAEHIIRDKEMSYG